MARLPMKMLALGVAFLAALSTTAADVCQTGTCLANGDTLCDRATAACPPCMYSISGGTSCYGKIGNACPYPDTLTICPEVVPTTAPAPTPAPVTTAPATVTPATVAPATVAPVATTVATPPAAVTPTTSDSASKADGTHPTSTPSMKKTSSVQTPEVTDVGTGTVAPANGSQPVTSPASAPKAMEAQDAMATADTKSAPKDSPKYVNIMIIAGAAVGVLVVVIFIVRRVRQRRDTPMDMGFDDLGFKSPATQGGGKEFSTAPSSAQARIFSEADQPHYTTTQPMANRIDYSTLEPEHLTAAAAARTKSRRQSRPSAAPSSVMLDDNQSELEFSIGLNSSTQSHDQDQYPVEHLYGEKLTAANRPRAKSRVRGIETSLIQNQYPELAGSYNSDVGSVIGSEADEFDIVDPGAIRPGERRNTETLVADGRFRQFSMASLAESYASDATTDKTSEYGNSVYI